MGIAVEPVEKPVEEPCYDSDCYYASGETLTWWDDYGYTPPKPVTPEPPHIDPPPSLIDHPSPEDSWPHIPSPPPSPITPPPSDSQNSGGGGQAGGNSGQTGGSGSQTGGGSGQTGGEDSGTSPLPVPETGDPLYRVIGDLLSSRPAPAQATPVVVQGRPTNPWPIALVGLAAVGAVAFLMARRKA